MKSCLKCREINRGKWKISGPARWPGGGQEVAMGVRMDNSSVWNKLSERNTVSAWRLCRQKAWSINTPAPSKSPFSLSLLGTGLRGSALGGSPRLYLKGDSSLFDNSQHFWKELQNTATCSDFLLCYLPPADLAQGSAKEQFKAQRPTLSGLFWQSLDGVTLA